MKIIFLDIDGCLSTLRTQWKTFDPDCAKALKRVVDITGAKIVLSSSWRHGFLDWRTGEAIPISLKNALPVMQELLTEIGLLDDCLIDKTPFVLSDHRGREIDLWLQKNPSVESFVILDDDDDVDPHKSRLVQTDGEKGMNEEDADKAISLLTS